MGNATLPRNRKKGRRSPVDEELRLETFARMLGDKGFLGWGGKMGVGTRTFTEFAEPEHFEAYFQMLRDHVLGGPEFKPQPRYRAPKGV